MTATMTDLRAYVEDLRAYVEDLRASVPYVHPAAQAIIHEWLQEMRDAADQDDAVTFARLARYVADKIKLEIEWQKITAHPRNRNIGN